MNKEELAKREKELYKEIDKLEKELEEIHTKENTIAVAEEDRNVRIDQVYVAFIAAGTTEEPKELLERATKHVDEWLKAKS